MTNESDFLGRIGEAIQKQKSTEMEALKQRQSEAEIKIKDEAQRNAFKEFKIEVARKILEQANVREGLEQVRTSYLPQWILKFEDIVSYNPGNLSRSMSQGDRYYGGNFYYFTGYRLYFPKESNSISAGFSDYSLREFKVSYGRSLSKVPVPRIRIISTQYPGNSIPSDFMNEKQFILNEALRIEVVQVVDDCFKKGIINIFENFKLS